jgi:hypothetical protein
VRLPPIPISWIDHVGNQYGRSVGGEADLPQLHRRIWPHFFEIGGTRRTFPGQRTQSDEAQEGSPGRSTITHAGRVSSRRTQSPLPVCCCPLGELARFDNRRGKENILGAARAAARTAVSRFQ